MPYIKKLDNVAPFKLKERVEKMGESMQLQACGDYATRCWWFIFVSAYIDARYNKKTHEQAVRAANSARRKARRALGYLNNPDINI